MEEIVEVFVEVVFEEVQFEVVEEVFEVGVEEVVFEVEEVFLEVQFEEVVLVEEVVFEMEMEVEVFLQEEVFEEVLVEEVFVYEVVEEEKKEEGGVEMVSQFQIFEDIVSFFFEEELRKVRFEKFFEDIVLIMIVFKWFGFLIDRVGIQNFERVLEFYYEIGWISEEVFNQFFNYVRGIRLYYRDLEWKLVEKLIVQDYFISLFFIERFRGFKINRVVFDKFEREIKMFEKIFDEFYGI